jgi:pimeloyl-ACP methyl ester carboxylesterase
MEAHRRILAARGRPASWRTARSADADYGRGDAPDWRTIRWPEHLRAVAVDSRRVHLVDIGSGPGRPILLVHGLGGRWQNWIENIPRLAADHRVVAIDLPGFGRSQLPAEPISIAGYARTLDHVCDLLELDAPLVGGNSLGALVVAELALRFPERVGALALVGPACLAPADLDSRTVQLALAAGGRIAGSLLRGPNGTVTRPRAQHILFATVLRHPTLIANDTLYELSSGVRPQGATAALAALRAHDISGELGAIAAPTLVVHGREDVLVPCADAEQIAAMISGAELLMFEDTGHMPMVERPVPFDDALLRFAGTLGRRAG